MESEGSLPHSQNRAIFHNLSQIIPVHNPTSTFLKIHLNIVLPSLSGSSKWSLSFRFTHQNPFWASPLPTRSTRPAHLILLDFITWIIFGEGCRTLSSSLCSVLHFLVASSLLERIFILLSTLCSDTLCLRSCFIVSNNATFTAWS